MRFVIGLVLFATVVFGSGLFSAVKSKENNHLTVLEGGQVPPPSVP